MSKAQAHGPVALLVSGFSSPSADVTSEGITARHSQTEQLAEVLRGHEALWSVRTLSYRSPDHQPDRRALKGAIRKAMQDASGGLLLALTLDVIVVEGKPAFVASDDVGIFPTSRTLELDWLRSELQDAESPWLILALDIRHSGVPSIEVFDLLDVGGYDRLLVVTESGRGEDPPWSSLTDLLASAPRTAFDLGELFTAMQTRCDPSRVALNGEPATPLQPAVTRELPRQNLTIPIGAHLSDTQGEPSLAESPSLVGATLPGRFQLVRELGRGAHGVVYAARQLSVNRLVAVKVFNHLTASHHRYLQSHFLDEIQTIGRLDHPNIVRIIQADQTPDGRLFYAMELVKGPTLRKLLYDEAPLDPVRAVNIIRKVLHGLHAAHAAGVIHADVKPDNIAVQQEDEDTGKVDRPVLLDFGVARLKTKNPNRTSQALGASAAYMAPEQAFEGVVDVRSDLFTTALVLYEMLTGWQRAELGEFVPPLTPNEVRDPHLLSVLRRGLSYDPSQRFQSAREFLDALVPDASAGDRADERQNPFRFLAAFTESDRWRFHGRVLATAQLTDLIVYNPFVVLVGPMGMGRTSLLRAGVTPRLADLRVQGVYVSCVDTPSRQAADAIVPGALDLRSALDTWFSSGSGRLVLMLDDLDALLHHEEGARERQTLFSMLHSCHRAYPERFGALIVVEPENLSMLSPLRHTLTEAPPVMRLGPLTTRGCREALVRSFEEFDVTLSAEAIDALLRRSTRLSRGEQGLFNIAAPHMLQLAGGLVFEALEARPAATLSGGDVEGILANSPLVSHWLDGVLQRIATEGHPTTNTLALLKAFLGEHGVRAVRNEAELGDMLPDFNRSTLEELVAEGLLARITRPGAALAWQLEHQALVDALESRGSA